MKQDTRNAIIDEGLFVLCLLALLVAFYAALAMG